MTSSEFVYATYIKSTPEKVWNALTSPEFHRQYWMPDMRLDGKKGSKWYLTKLDGNSKIVGEILESQPPKKLVMSWAGMPADPDDGGPSRVTFEIESIEDVVQLRVTHGELKAGSAMAEGISGGWPRVLSSLKSLLETGAALNAWAGCGQTAA